MHATNSNHLTTSSFRLVAASVVLTTMALLVFTWHAPRPSLGAPSEPLGLDSVSGNIVYTRGNGGNWDIYVSDARGEGEAQLTSSDAIEFDPRWSHNGREVAFHTREDLVTVWRIPFTGGPPVAIVERIIADYWAGFPAWNPTDDCISYAGSHPSYDGRTDLKIWCSDDTAGTLVASDDRNESSSDWSADGSAVAYEAEPAAGQGGAFYWGLRAVDADGSNDRVLVDWQNSSERHPRWSPNGDQVAFMSYPNAFGLGAGSLYLMDLTTGLVTEVLRQSVAGPPAWSPDGTQLVATAIKDGGPEPVGDFELIGALPPGERKGLYLVDLTDRSVERLLGAAGGSGGRPGLFEWGYGPDWSAGTATTVPTYTNTPTATITPTTTPTATPTEAPLTYLPLALRYHVIVTATPNSPTPYSPTPYSPTPDATTAPATPATPTPATPTVD